MLNTAFATMQSPIELGEVVAVNDPEGLSRVEVRFLSRGPLADDPANKAKEDSTPWALVAVPVAGDLFDVAFRANRRNVALLRQHLDQAERKRERAGP